MRPYAFALCMVALAGGAAGITGVGRLPVSSPEFSGESSHDVRYREAAGKPNDPWRNLTAEEAADHGEPICNCKTGRECDCVDCVCEGCPCKTTKRVVDPLTGIEVSGPAVIMISAPWCAPCQAAKRSEFHAQIPQKGWEYHVDETQKHRVRVYPTYRIFNKGKWWTVEGELTAKKMLPEYADTQPVQYSGSNLRVGAPEAAVVRDPAAAAAVQYSGSCCTPQSAPVRRGLFGFRR